MALALTVDKVDTLPEAVRGLYVEKDGKYHLDVDGIEDTTGLKNSLAALRTEKATLEKATKEFAKLGKTPAEISEMLAAKATEAEEALKKAGKHDEILAKKEGEWKARLTEAESKLSGERDTALGFARKAVVDAQVSTSLAKAKVTEEGLALLVDKLGTRVKVDFTDGKQSLQILAADGSEMVGTAKDGTATFDDLVADAKKLFPSLFEGTGAGGGGASAKGGKTGDKVITRKDLAALDPAEQMTRMTKGGWKVVD